MNMNADGQYRIGLTNALLAILIAAFIAVNGYWSSKLSSLENEVVKVRINMAEATASRFTSEDGLKVWSTISNIQHDVARLSERIDDNRRDS